MQSGGLRTKGITKFSRPGEPLISVVTVVYNGAATLEQTIRSVLGQTYGNVEYIIIDGGSTDGTLDIIRKYGDRIDFWQSGPDGGIYDAMNKGLHHINGDWYIFLGSDDRFYGYNTIKETVPYLRDNKIIYGDVILVPCNIRYNVDTSLSSIIINNICQQSIFYPKVIRRIPFNTEYTLLADYDLNLRLLSNPENEFLHIDKIISFYSIDGSSSTKRDIKFEKDFKRNLINYFGFWRTVFALLYNKLTLRRSLICQILR